MDNDDFIVKMSKQAVLITISLFMISVFCKVYDISFFMISSFYLSLFFSAAAGLQLVVAIDWYYDGRMNRPFSLMSLYLIGIILGIIIYFLVISYIPNDIINYIQSILNIKAVR